eukprot:g1191.t1
MGSHPSKHPALLREESANAASSIDGADVFTPRNESAIAEIVRLRGLLRANVFLDGETGHLHAVGTAPPAVGLSTAAADGGDGGGAEAGGEAKSQEDSVWEHVTDPESKSLYWYNWTTGESTWDTPPGQEGNEGRVLSENSHACGANKHLWAMLRTASQLTKWDGPWTLFTDPKTGSTFFYNTETGISCWEKPSSKEEEEAMRREAASAWQCVLSPTGDVLYYYNASTGESTYDVPESVQKTNEQLEAEQAEWAAEWDAYYAEQQALADQEVDELKRQIVEKESLSTEAQAKLDQVLQESAKLQGEEGEAAAKVKAMTADLDAGLQQALEQVNAERAKKKNDLQARLDARKKARAQALAHQHSQNSTHLSNVLFKMATQKEAVNDRWHKAVHDKTGLEFFFNSETKAVSWTHPDEEAPVPQ